MKARLDDLIMPGMGFPARQAASAPSLPQPTTLAGGIRYFTGFFGTLTTAFACLMIAQFYFDACPPGMVQSFALHKGTYDVVLTNGRRGTYPDAVLRHVRSKPPTLRAGDLIAKEQCSFVYYLNGKPATDFWWAWNESVNSTFTGALFVCFAASSVIGTVRVRHKSGLASGPELVRLLGVAIATWIGATAIWVIVFEVIIHAIFLLVYPIMAAR